MGSLDHLIAIAETQHGLVTNQQARSCDISPRQLRGFVVRHRLERVTASILRVPGSPATDDQETMAAVLDAGPGAALSAAAGLAYWHVSGFALRPFHVLHVRDSLRRKDPLAIRHSSRCIPPHHIKVLNGIPVTSPTRCLFDVAAFVHPARLERAVDVVWGLRLTSGELLHDMFDELGTPRRPGMKAMKEVLATRDRTYAPPESNLERRFHQLVERDGQPPMRRQVDVGAEVWLGRVDAIDDQARVIARVDGSRFHTALLDRQHDQVQAAAMASAGFRVLVFTEHDIWHRGSEAMGRLRAVRQAGRRKHGGLLLAPAA